jgi:hypothetical protein
VGVDDAVARVRGLPSQLEAARRLEVEARSRRLQLAHARRPFLDEDLDGVPVAERRPGGERVLAVQLGGVAGA